MKQNRTMIMLAVAAVITAGCLPISVSRPDHEIRITVDLPEAKEVIFLSSLSRYEPVSMNKTFGGTWEIRLPEDKSFDYFFRVDGNPYTPDCRLKQADEWGGHLCIYSPGTQEP